MAECFLVQGGGGGAGLNFKVVGNPQPSNHKENTIWIDTDTKITSWIFSATEPEAPEDGVDGPVWISTGTSSTVEFNALKKNGIQVYPISAKQYISGAWVGKTAKSWQGGEWVDWFDGVLYNNGKFWGDYTTYKGTSVGSISINTSDITLITGNGTNLLYVVFDKIDVTNYNTITMYGEFYDSGSDNETRAVLYIAETNSTGTAIAKKIDTKANGSRAVTTTLDVSGHRGEVYIYAGQETGAWSVTRKLRITKVVVE